jgi:hypothetical protein
MPERLDEGLIPAIALVISAICVREGQKAWRGERSSRTGAPAAMRVYRLGALAVGARLAGADGYEEHPFVPAMSSIRSHKT